MGYIVHGFSLVVGTLGGGDSALCRQKIVVAITEKSLEARGLCQGLNEKLEGSFQTYQALCVCVYTRVCACVFVSGD